MYLLKCINNIYLHNIVYLFLGIKKRRLDVFFEIEEKIMSGTTLDK